MSVVKVTLNDGTTNLELHPPQFTVRDHYDVYKVGPSVGRDLPVAGSDGDLERDRRRGPLPVTLRNVFVNGRSNPDGSAAADPRTNLRTLLRQVTTWLEDGPRRLTMTVEDGTVTLTAAVTFEDMSGIRGIGSDLAEFDLLFTVASGRFEESS